jgi:hypothetical protein
MEQILFPGCGVETELPIVVGNSVSFELLRSSTWKIEMNQYHMRKYNLHFTGGTVPGECYVWKHGNSGWFL